jgi:hypothetical protein
MTVVHQAYQWAVKTLPAATVSVECTIFEMPSFASTISPRTPTNGPNAFVNQAIKALSGKTETAYAVLPNFKNRKPGMK